MSIYKNYWLLCMSKSVKIVSYENSASFGSKSDEGFIQDGMQACFYAPIRFWMVSTEMMLSIYEKKWLVMIRWARESVIAIAKTLRLLANSRHLWKFMLQRNYETQYFFIQEPKKWTWCWAFLFFKGDPLSKCSYCALIWLVYWIFLELEPCKSYPSNWLGLI